MNISLSRQSLMKVASHRLFWPAVMLVGLMLVNLPSTPGYFTVGVRNGHLYGSLINILIFTSPHILVAVGLTLVIATAGIDLSVGAVAAIAGTAACWWVARASDQNAATTALLAIGIGLGAGLACGLWNGFFVARMGIQPIVATLTLMVAGRGVAQLIGNGQIITVNSSSYALIGGWWGPLPSGILIAVAVVVATILFTRRTALGMLIESVGGNAEAARLAGVRATRIKWTVYVFCGVCAAIAGLMLSSNTSSADANNSGLWYELDGILAVVLGGTSLTGGRFHLGGTVLGALVIGTLNNTLFALGVPAQSNLVFEGAVVIIVCLLQSPVFRARFLAWRKRIPLGVAVAAVVADTGAVEAGAAEISAAGDAGAADVEADADATTPTATPPTTEVSR
ncbi:MAG: sugar ABC transporter permease [Catenulispora sp. 13_1_20CM_3_70_7]|jgi:galactofuranose transport system permease protein|nr:MAG: sugar ABC transporter permease [Catenulispora sp. 13_1_20CM_3_70_7]